MIDLYDPDDRSQKLERKGNVLVSVSGKSYPIINEIPRFVEDHDEGQTQTSESFGYKWNRQKCWANNSEQIMWTIWKDFFGWDTQEELRKIMMGKKVLDAGCGCGTSMSQFVEWPAYLVGVDISTAIDACMSNFPDPVNRQFIQADLNKLPFADEQFDVVWSNGVLHHTPDTYESLKAITRHLRRGGTMIFYIYVKKAAVREFVDDYLRNIISEMPPEAAWRRMEVFTRFSKALAETNVDITLEEDFPELGFKKGKYNLQRFIYYNVFKCFWNPALSFDDNVNVNFDWYHPKYSHRHSPDEIREWLSELGLKEKSFQVSESGIGVIAEKY